MRRTAILRPRNQIWILARTLAVLPFHTGESWASVHNPTEPRGRRRSETLLSRWKNTHLAAPRTTSHATRRRPAPGNAVVHCRLTSQPATCVPLPLNTYQGPLAFLRWLNTIQAGLPCTALLVDSRFSPFPLRCFGFAQGPYRRSNNYRKQNVSFPI